MTILIIGGDSQIGYALSKYINERKIITTRRKNLESNEQYFDLNHPQDINKSAFKACTTAVILAGITSIDFCEKNPRETYKINVDNTIQLLHYLNKKNIFTVFISSSAIFSEAESNIDEKTLPLPSNQYGLQKLLVEDYIKSSDELRDAVTILRLTKVLSKEDGFIYENMTELKCGNKIFAYSDLLISPISLPYVTKCIAAVIDKKIPGIFNLSNQSELSYFDFFIEIAKKMQINPTHVFANSAIKEAKNIIFWPVNPSLGMKNTTEKFGILPESLEDVLNYLTT